MCSTCFKGNHFHVLHEDKTHPLLPINPGIHYRYYENWICEACGDVGGHKAPLKNYFHCKKCDQDICNNCFMGNKHHLHEHNLVERNNNAQANGGSSDCSECRRTLRNNYYLCKRPDCSYFLCNDCYSIQPKPHPLHPKYGHVLHVTDKMQVYPESGGQWYCDNCGTASRTQDKLYHCSKCGYDLCGSCNMDYRPTKSPPIKTPPTSPRKKASYITSKDQYHIPILANTLVNYVPSSIAANSPGLCKNCGLSIARVTPVHKGVAHSAPLYCEPCGNIVLNSREPCCLCGRVPDHMTVV